MSGEMSGRLCRAKNRAGEPCGMAALDGSDFCWTHDPRMAAKRAAARRKGGIASRAPSRATAPPSDDPVTERLEVSLTDIPAVRSILERVVADEMARPSSTQRTRTVVYALTLAVKSLEVGEIEERIMALEARVNANENRHRMPWQEISA